MRLFSQMDEAELRREIERLEAEERRLRREGLPGEREVVRQRINLARSYLTDPASIRPGRWYRAEGYKGRFQVDYLNGVMAWGRWEGKTEQTALPIGILKPDDEHDD